MATGRSNKLVGQTGEYLVAAELSRRGLIATTFTGNVPHYDIIASNESVRHVSVQVKTSRGSSWQFGNVQHYFELTFQGKRQIVGKAMPCPVQRLIMVFVELAEYGSDYFYICKWTSLRNLLKKRHIAYLDKHNGVRPKRWDSLHAAIHEKDLSQYRGKWETIEDSLK